MSTKKVAPSWSGVKLTLRGRDGLTSLIQDLYSTSKDNQSFLYARLGPGDDLIKPYRATIDRWLWPDPFKNQVTSVAKAKKAIADYKRAVGDPAGLAELAVFHCDGHPTSATTSGCRTKATSMRSCGCFAKL